MDIDFKKVLRKHIDVITKKIRERPTGSEADKKMLDYISGEFEDCGLKTTRQEFPLNYWQKNNSRLVFERRELPHHVNTFSKSCDIESDIVPAGAIGALEKAGINGKTVLLYGELTHTPLLPKNFKFYTDERSAKIVSILEEKRPAVILTLCNDFARQVPIIEDRDFLFPSMTISPDTALELMKKRGEKVRIVIDSEYTDAQSANISGMLQGKSDKKLLIMAHCDSYYTSPGAMDNGTGVAMLMLLARALAGEKFDTGIEFLAINGHENAGQGFTRYLELNRHASEKISCVVNIDLPGCYLAVPAISIMQFPDEIKDKLSRIVIKNENFIETGPWYYGEHSALMQQGIPAIAATSQWYPEITHHFRDSGQWVDEKILFEYLPLLKEMIGVINRAK